MVLIPIEFQLINNKLNDTINYLLNTYEDVSKHIKTKSSGNSDLSHCIINPDGCPSSFNTGVNAKIPPQWVQFELKRSIIYIDSYSLKSSGNDPNSRYHLRSWKLLASIDGRVWEEIDRKVNSSALDGPGKSSNFECKRGLYRFFRIVQTEKNNIDKYGFTPRQVELFGTFYESQNVPRIIPCTNTRNDKITNSILLYAFIIY